MLTVNNLSSFHGSVQALKDVSLHVDKGEIVTVIGANGSGKSTLLNSISGVITQKKGEITLDGIDISKLHAERIVGHGITLVPEGRQVFSSLSVMENLEMGGYLTLKKRKKGQFKDSLGFVFDLFPPLKERRNQLSSTLSGGEQQMLAIGRALMAKPKVLMLDEPSMGLAPMVIRSIFDVLRQLNKEGLTILLVEQDARIALSIADRGYIFQTGQVVLKDKAKNLIDNPMVKEIYFGKQI